MGSPLTVVSLFDGIGGFCLAFERAGAKTVATVEIDKPAAAVSARHFPDAHQFDDVMKVTGVVRRLTERECERLQGYDDDWTAGQSGSARYRQLGNSVAVPVVEWIARRMVAVDDQIRGET